ncbi:MAG: histidine kinase dimerization/phosphoacceptor domain -containing protein [Candidatus Binatia bacterium]
MRAGGVDAVENEQQRTRVSAGGAAAAESARTGWREPEEILREMAQLFSRPVTEAAPPLSASEAREEKGMRASEGGADARYRSLVEQIPAVTFTAALSGDEIEFYVSPHIEALLGFSQQEWLSDPFLWYKQLHADDRELCNREFARGCRTRGPFRAEFRALTRAGEVVWVRGEARVVRDDAGHPLFIQGVAYDITESKRAEEALRATAEQIKASLAEKEVLLREIHHRVKNNLQVISSLLKLQSSHVEDRAALELFNDSRHRIQSMALVHEKLYQSRNLSRVDFGDYVQNLTALLFRSYGARVASIELEIIVGHLFLSIDTAVPLGLIINELVSNCIKYAFPGGRRGRVRLELKPCADEGRAEVLVADDGVGFPADIDFRETETLGMQLVRALTHQIGGSVELRCDGGTEFSIRFPG